MALREDHLFQRIISGLVWGAAADICLPWSVPHHDKDIVPYCDVHCIWEPLSSIVVQSIYTVMLIWYLCSCFSFYLWFRSNFQKEKGVAFFKIPLYKTLTYHYCQAGFSICRLVLQFMFNTAFRVDVLNERRIRACACLRPFSDFLPPSSYSWNSFTWPRKFCMVWCMKIFSLISFLSPSQHTYHTELFVVSQLSHVLSAALLLYILFPWPGIDAYIWTQLKYCIPWFLPHSKVSSSFTGLECVLW